MEKKEKLFEPIRHRASSLPPVFTKELKEMEIVFPYPKKIGENKYELAPGMYCTKNVVKDYFDEFKRTLGMKKKKYCFDYIREDVMKWAPEVRKNVTKQMLYMIPLRVLSPFISPEQISPPIDYYGDTIDDYSEWNRQREEYIEELYRKLKNGEE